MENQQTQQPSSLPPSTQTTTTTTATVPRNNKNLSIKEFFTNRLMRTRSFEGAQGSPKDEATNWFDEFKARMIKKSQAKGSISVTAHHSNNTEDEDSNGPSNEPSVRFASSTQEGKSKQHHGKEEDLLVKDSCDTTNSGGKLTETRDDEDSSKPYDNSKFSSDTNTDVSEACKTTSQTTRSCLRTKKLQRISCVDRPDFDTASINTIFNRRDSRYAAITRRRKRMILTRLLGYFRFIIAWLVPFNYNLPWKLLSFMNFSFVILIIALISGQNPNIKAFNFFYGFVSGLLVATSCALLLSLSILVQFLPKSPSLSPESDNATDSLIDSQQTSSYLQSPNISSINSADFSREDVSLESPELCLDEFSNYEILEGGNRTQDDIDVDTTLRNEALLDDDNYRGWMIEFIGDYELRNKSDIKLKLIFVKIENRVLHLCKTKNSNDADSATFPTIVQQRIYDLSTAKKFTANLLLPKNVRNRQKWIWSKKYPIKLDFQIESETLVTSSKSATTSTDGIKTIQLTLFAKSCREKEEWFRRLKRIVEDNRIAMGQLSNKRCSFQSNLSGGGGDTSENPTGSLKSFRCRSPSPTPRCDSVQTSRSSHLLGESNKCDDSDNEKLRTGSSSSTNLIRTRSCEILQQELASSTSASPDPLYNNQADADETTCVIETTENDSTLTRATAEMFSQAVEYSNFMESRPTFDYKDYIERVIESNKDATSTSDWFNSLTGRIFFDVFSHNFWSVWFKRKIQSKLYRIRLPYFMETLTLTKIDLGTNAPHFLNVASHTFDSFGLSIDFDMAYSGGLTMTFETKLNLLKIKTDSTNQSTSASNTNSASNNQTPSSGNLNAEQVTKDSGSVSESSLDSQQSSKDSVKASFSSSGSTRTSGESSDSDESDSDSSSDSSFDEADVDEISDWEDYGAEKTRQSIVRFVDKIASSRYFQQATENRYIKKKLQDISNCPLVLVVKIESLNGVLTLNVPPPQTDRVWYGFKPNPELTLKALPKMGDREVNLSHVTDWIERKLAEEFRKILVIPNMEDIVLPILKSDHLQYVMTTK